jgi:hypothetical protein
MRSPSRWWVAAILLLALLLVLPLAVGLLALQDEPGVAARSDIAPADVDRALAIARRNDPRLAMPGQPRELHLSERDADLLLYHGAQHWLDARTRVTLRPGRAEVRASVELPPLRRWLNVEMQWQQTASLPELMRWRVGRLPLPRVLFDPLLARTAARYGLQGQLRQALQALREVRFGAGELQARYELDAGSARRMLAALVPPDDQARLRVYQAALRRLADAHAPDADTSLATLLPPLFALARERSAAGGDAVQENRAAILVLTFFVNGRGLDLLLPAARAWPAPRPLRVTLQGRDDFPKHFLISALIAAEADTPLADAVGVWKELSDARGGSGFSFNDIAADRAGTRFGEMAVRAPALLQARLAGAAQESVFMVDATGLPEYLPEAEFRRRYGGVGAPAYDAMRAEIEARIAALPLFAPAR